MTKYRCEYNLENLRDIAEAGTDQQVQDGLHWYDVARRISHTWAAEFNLQPITVAGVLAALSPHNHWNQNVVDARAIIEAVTAGHDAWAVKVCTFDANKRKAITIASSDTIDALKGQKVRSFVHNIAHEDSECVTIDTHAFNACCGARLIRFCPIKKNYVGPSVTPKRYREMSEMYHELAKEYGIRGYQMQAIIWVIWRSRD